MSCLCPRSSEGKQKTAHYVLLVRLELKAPLSTCSCRAEFHKGLLEHLVHSTCFFPLSSFTRSSKGKQKTPHYVLLVRLEFKAPLSTYSRRVFHKGLLEHLVHSTCLFQTSGIQVPVFLPAPLRVF
ncbi:hypothetical protein GN956_G4567 [Arapaima gigas]